LNKLLVVDRLLEAKNDGQALLLDKPKAILAEVIQAVTKEVELRDRFNAECG
jgi:hypothetical protein